MKIAVLTLELYIPWATSLKDKRNVRQSMLTKLRGKFNVTVAEIGQQDQWRHLQIGVACFAATRALADQMLDSILDYVEQNWDVQLVGQHREWM